MFLVTKKIQIKATMKFHVTPSRMGIFRNEQSRVLRRMWKEWEPSHIPGENVHSLTTMEISVAFLKIIKWMTI